MFSLLFSYSLRRTRRYFRDNRAAKLATVAIFLGIVFLLMAGIYSFFSHTLRFIVLADYFNDAILLYLYELFMFAVFLLVFASALITGLFGLFSGKDRILIAVSPKFPLLPLLVLSRMFITSLWPILIIVLPVLFALARNYPLSFFGSFLTLLSLALFVALAVLSALALILIAAWAIQKLRRRFLRFETLAIAVSLVAMIAFFSMWQNVSSIRLNTLFRAEAVELATADSSLIRDHFAFLPSHPAAQIFFSASRDDLGQILKSLSFLSFLVLFAAGLFFLLKKRHLELWQTFQENSTARKPASFAFFRNTIARSAGPYRALFRRELVIFFRSTSGMTWFGFFCLIWLLQVGSMFILGHKLSERPAALPYLVIALQVAATIYFVNMFVLRFVFPAFSMDPKMSRIIQSAPIDAAALFIGRAVFYTPLFAFLGAIFTILNTFIMETSLFGSAVILGSIALASITITLYGLALGALFPNPETDDPELLSTSLPGLAFIFTSLLYGGLAAYAVRDSFLRPESPLLLLFVLFSIGFGALSVFLSLKKLSRGMVAP